MILGTPYGFERDVARDRPASAQLVLNADGGAPALAEAGVGIGSSCGSPR